MPFYFYKKRKVIGKGRKGGGGVRYAKDINNEETKGTFKKALLHTLFSLACLVLNAKTPNNQYHIAYLNRVLHATHCTRPHNFDLERGVRGLTGFREGRGVEKYFS